MGGRGAVSSSTKATNTLASNITKAETRLKNLKQQEEKYSKLMDEFVQFTGGSINYNEKKAEKYYEYQRKFNDVRTQRNELENKIKTAVIIDPKKINTSKVGVGCKVTVTNIKTNASFEYTIVGDTDANPLQGLISNVSPVGAGLMGKKVGEVAIIKTPAGITQFKITKIKI